MASLLTSRILMRGTAGKLLIATQCVRSLGTGLPVGFLISNRLGTGQLNCKQTSRFNVPVLSSSIATSSMERGGYASRRSRHRCLCQFCGVTHGPTDAGGQRVTVPGMNTERENPGFLTSRRGIHTGCALWAGHNKWSKVKYIKGPKDLEKSKVFTKIGIQVKIAIRESGANPETNTTLASLISLAKSKSMPKATMDAIIKKAAASKQGDTQATFEARGPGNSSLLINILTDNTRRTRAELTHLAIKNGGTFGEQGTALFAFGRKGVIAVPSEVEGQGSMSFDEAEELAIDVGAEEVTETTDEDRRDMFVFICDPSDLRSVRDGLTERSHRFQSYSLEYVPQTTIALSESDLEAAARLIDALESHEDVVKVYDNIISKD